MSDDTVKIFKGKISEVWRSSVVSKRQSSWYDHIFGSEMMPPHLTAICQSLVPMALGVSYKGRWGDKSQPE